MAMNVSRAGIAAILLVAIAPAWPAAPAGAEETGKITYAVEINDTRCGYAELEVSPIERDGRELTMIQHHVFVMISALGSTFNSDVELTYYVDPVSGQFTYHDSDLKQGDLALSNRVYIEDGAARFVYPESGEEKTVELGGDVLLENTYLFPHLVRDFAQGKAKEKTYRALDVRDAVIQNWTYRHLADETIELAGEKHDAIVLEKHVLDTGIKANMWIDRATGVLLKTTFPNNRKSYLARPADVKDIMVAKLDESVITRVNVSIADTKAIEYMKVRAVFEPTGLVVDGNELSVPGQSFSGTVEGNRIDGVFEIEHSRYDGADAPPFPPDFSGDETLKPFLEAKDFIESDDPVLIEQARKITDGSKDSWEAAVRLSEWVADEIGYAIPGGGTARKTYDIRAGECGAHSILLASFCRAVGIPARVVWGCMYVPNFGGAFGQHGWNEIYMGDAGWVPVDATAREVDYLDSGHIRIGEYQSVSTALNAQGAEIIDYRIAGTESGEEAADRETAYEPYTGEYDAPRGDEIFTVLMMDGSLTVDIPNRVKLALNDPDEEGRWVSKLAPHVYCTFDEGDNGAVETMWIHEVVSMPRTADIDSIPEGVPAELLPYLGVYRFAAARADFTVRCVDGGLVVDDPLDKSTVGLQPPDEQGGRLDQYGK
ncbi:MAG TPA: transglutaminase domain-containing protein, partial [Candidatus Eisenbacteria bacterium]|nr:transglutaminase domain-containing protein [Candidatus Eisenbacteria bacterium]